MPRFESLPAGVQEHVVSAADLASKRALRATSRSMRELVTPRMKFESAEIAALADDFAKGDETYALRKVQMMWWYESELQVEEPYQVDEPPEFVRVFLEDHGVASGEYALADVSRLLTAQLRWATGCGARSATCSAIYACADGTAVQVSAMTHMDQYAHGLTVSAMDTKTFASQQLSWLSYDTADSSFFDRRWEQMRVVFVDPDPPWMVALYAAAARVARVPGSADVDYLGIQCSEFTGNAQDWTAATAFAKRLWPDVQSTLLRVTIS